MNDSLVAPTPRVRPVHYGPLGRCPCCGEATEVRILSTHGVKSQWEWVVPREVLATLYRVVAERIRDRGGKLYVIDPHPHNPKTVKRLYFVEGGDSLAGPFGAPGLESFIRDTAAPEATHGMWIYAVHTTARALQRIRQSPYSRSPADAPQGPIDGPVDLF